MVIIQKVVLDVLKPHSPSGFEFARALAEQGPGYRVTLAVAEMDEKTETVVITVEGDDIHMQGLEDTINTLGGSLHSVDEIVVVNHDQSD